METGRVSSAADTGIALESDGDPWIVASMDASNGAASTHVWHRDGLSWERWLVTTSSGPGSIVVDGSDTPHISFSGKGPGTVWGHWYATLAGSSWSFEQIDTGGQGVLLLDSNEELHVVYDGPGLDTITYAEQTSSGWSKTTLTTTDYCCALDAAIDGQDRIHVAYINNQFKAKAVHGLFDPATSAWTTSTLHACEGSPSVAVDSSDVPHVACWERDTGLLHYTKDAGGAWVHEVVTDGSDLVPPRAPVNVAMETSTVVDGQDRVHIVFRTRKDISFDNPLAPAQTQYAIQGADGTWQVETVDRDGFFNGAGLNIVIDGQDRPWISYVYSRRVSGGEDTPVTPKFDLRLARPVIADAMDPVGTVT